MLRTIAMWAALGGAAVLLSGCFWRARTQPVTYGATYNGGVAADGVVVYQAPPQPQVVVQQPAVPYQGAVWVQGHWTWNGAQYVWSQGHYVQPRVGHVYVQPRWQRRGTGYVYVGGGWRAGAHRRAVRQQRQQRRQNVRQQRQNVRQHRQQRRQQQRVQRQNRRQNRRTGMRVRGTTTVVVPRVEGRATVQVR